MSDGTNLLIIASARVAHTAGISFLHFLGWGFFYHPLDVRAVNKSEDSTKCSVSASPLPHFADNKQLVPKVGSRGQYYPALQVGKSPFTVGAAAAPCCSLIAVFEVIFFVLPEGSENL